MADVQSPLSMDEIFAAVAAALAETENVREPGEFTVAEFAEHFGLSYGVAGEKLRKLEKAGKLRARRLGAGKVYKFTD